MSDLTGGIEENTKKNDEYFMAFALLAATKSSDPKTQVGACIVKNGNLVVGLGYNSMPNYQDENDVFPWNDRKSIPSLQPKWYHKHSFVCHAELNAIVNCSTDINGCSMYSTLFPCNECAKLIIQSGIKEVIYLSDKFKKKDDFQSSRFMLKKMQVNLRKFETDKEGLTLNFQETRKRKWSTSS